MTYKGRTAFNTLFGGLVTIIVILGLLMYFVYELRAQFLFPEYHSLPVSYDYYDDKPKYMDAAQNTIAVAFNAWAGGVLQSQETIG